MFRWCAYCQKFLGEKEPKDDFSVTHGMCPECKSKTSEHRRSIIDAAKPMMDFYSQLRESVYFRRHLSPSEILKRARELGIAPTDLVAGVMQPLLDEIAQRQQKGEATIGHEHEFSMIVEGILHEIGHSEANSAACRSVGKADIVLACCDGNYHVFGVRLINECLIEAGIATRCIFPSYPFSEIIETARRSSARVIGVSVAMPEQLKLLLEHWRSYQESRPEGESFALVIGGPGVGLSDQSEKGVHIHTGSLADFRALIQDLLAPEGAATRAA